MNEKITLIPMTMKHIDEVYEIEKEAFAIPWTKASLQKEIEENNLALYLVALAGDEVVGYAGMWHVINEGHITNIAVKHSYRQRGIGDILVKRLIAIAEAKEMIGLTLEVRVGNLAARNLYKNNGFTEEGLRRNYYEDTGEDAIIMWKLLSTGQQ